MARSIIGCVLSLLCWFPLHASAQSAAAILGTVTDESKAVLPGVTVTATEVSSGREYVATTDASGQYRMPSVLPGTYHLQAELAGFATVRAENIELLVGQSATMGFSLKLATVNETVTVTGLAPLINTQSAVVGGNIDRRQMVELPVLGRNWMEMSMLVKGITANSMAGNRAGAQRDDQVQLNLDGQQITQNISDAGSFGQPSLSREAISEYQLSTSMYDVTQGRSVGLQVQAVSRSGTNDLRGAVYGNFRDDALNAKDFIAQRVLPYSNQQAGFSLGGPIVQNRFHYFGTYEYERQPDTTFINPAGWANAPIKSISFQNTQRSHNMLVRGDYQMSNTDRLSVRGMYWDSDQPFTNLTSTTYPTSAADALRNNVSVIGNWSRILTDNLVQEVKIGYSKYDFSNVLSPGVPPTPVYQQVGQTAIGASRSYPQQFYQKTPSFRYDLTWHRGKHDLKIGADYLLREDGAYWPNQARGVFNINGETADSWARRFPLDAWNDPTRWDLTGLNVADFTQNFAYDFNVKLPRKTWALWINDTWAVNNRLTLNYGLRWDVDWGGLDAPGNVDYPVFLSNGRDPDNANFGYITGIRDLTAVGPRGGFTYKLNEGLIVRAGGGLFYNFQESNLLTGTQQQITNERRVISAVIKSDGRPDFITNPLGNATPEDYLSGRLPLPPIALRNLNPEYRNPRSLQVTAGFQKQLGEYLGFDADLMYTKGMRLGYDRDVNQFYDAATGYPKNNSISRPNPDFGTIRYYYSTLKSEYLALATSFTRRLHNRWQMGGTYTLMFDSKDHNTGGLGFTANNSNPFCQECEWGTSNTFQRHTIRLNGIYEAPWGISLASIFSFGSGTPTAISFGNAPAGYPIQIGGTSFSTNRYVTARSFTIPREVTFPDGSVREVYDRLADGTPTSYVEGDELPRNAFRGLPISKVDVRASKAMLIPGTTMKITGMFEVFNLLNHANYSQYNAVVNNPNFGRPSAALQPRTIQLAFRVDF